MAITPYSTPTQYQYKPLNLMAFAEPLMKMQEKYDLTKASLEDADVKATALQFANDPIKAKELENLYRTKRDELISNLMETKNYTQAASKLKQLNKLWTEDPERVALETNYKTFVERDKEEADRVAKGDITPEEYRQWRREEIAKFEELGGTSYKQDAANPAGTYNPITGKVGRMINMQKDFDEVKYKAASAMKAKEWDSGLAALGIDPTSGDAKYLKQSFERLRPEEIDAAVENYMRGLERFKPWLQEKAAYDFKDIVRAKDGGASYNKVATELLQRNYQANEARIKELEKQKKTDSEEYKTALENREFLTQQLEDPNQNVIQSLFTQNYMNKQYDASALGQIFKVNNIKSDYTFRDIPSDGSGSGTDFSLDGLGRTSPTTKELSITNLNGLRVSATKQMLPNIGNINNMAGGLVRTIVAGPKGSDLRNQLTATPGLMVARQEKLLAALQGAKDVKDFKRKLYESGLSSGASENVVNTLWNEFRGQGGEQKMQVFKNNLAKMEDAHLQFQDAYDQLTTINENVAASPTFNNYVTTQSTVKVPVGFDAVQKLAKAWGKTTEQLINSGVVEYTPARSAKESYAPAEYRLSGNNIAKAYGFKDFKDAVQKGFNFSSAGANGIQAGLDNAKQQAIVKDFSGQTMGVRIVGDKIVDKALGDELMNANELTRFVPLNVKTWQDQPGFDEEGRLLGGTKLDDSKPPKVGIRGNKVFLEVFYSYKDEDGDIKYNSVEVSPRAGDSAIMEKILRRTAQNNYQIKDKDPLALQTYNDVMVGLYNVSSSSNLTEARGKAADVTATRPRAILETIPSGSAGVNVQLVKEFNNGNPVYKAYAVSAGGKQDLGVKAGSVNALKVAVAELMYYNYQ